MHQDVKTPPPHEKKLFEWDAEKRRLAVIKRKQKYLYELGADNMFVCIDEKDKQTQE
ncbi:MAG: hypothetical protein GX804_05365 [Lentisphaerae bacterium]|nr:hypothetical protein [Lentisphaerota bacterium]